VSGKSPNLRDFVGMGSVLAGQVAGGLVLGWLVDKGLHTLPVFTLVGLAAGLVAAAFYLYSVYQKFSKD
jgi:F0F1-type ATP synthase assembly protein I